MTFIVNDIDFSENVQESTYTVDQKDVYTEWQDANGRKHRTVTRTKISGSFDMVFTEGLGEGHTYFLAALAAATEDNVLHATVSVNNTNSTENIDCYYSLDFSAVRQISERQTYKRCTFTLEEC